MLHVVFERDALDKLHDDILDVFPCRDVIDVHYILVRKHGNGARLIFKPFNALLILGNLILEYLYCDNSPHKKVGSFKNYCHAADSDDALYPITVIEDKSDIFFI